MDSMKISIDYCKDQGGYNITANEGIVLQSSIENINKLKKYFFERMEKLFDEAMIESVKKQLNNK